ncbi:hypothetical protein THAOC_29274, partial [Thalassiosira oceanica]
RSPQCQNGITHEKRTKTLAEDKDGGSGDDTGSDTGSHDRKYPTPKPPEKQQGNCITAEITRRCSGRQRGLSCSAKCSLHADGSIWSVRGLLRPQTTIDAPMMPTIIDLSAPICERLMCGWVVFDFHMAFSTPKKERSQIRHMTPLDKPLLPSPVPSSARFANFQF